MAASSPAVAALLLLCCSFCCRLGLASAAQGCARGEVPSCRAAEPAAADHVLLQSSSHRGRLLAASPAAAAADEGEAESCDACLAAVDAEQGCASMLDSEFIFDHELADFDAECGHCSSEVLTHCFPLLQSGTCDACVEAFDVAGGCEVMKQIMGELHDNPLANVSALQAQLLERIPLGCQPCGEDAARHCSASLEERRAGEVLDPAACEVCIEALDETETDSCAGSAVRGAWPYIAGGIEACEGVGEACQEVFRVHCDEKEDSSAGDCKTAVPGEQCYMSVRWAMQVGISKHPEWYQGLTQGSSFEDFQRHMHSKSRHGCPAPCAAAVAACRTAREGEECYRHVAWAKEVGVSAVPQWYPASLTASSPAEEFQAWLHQIHHGGCPRPCAV